VTAARTSGAGRHCGGRRGASPPCAVGRPCRLGPPDAAGMVAVPDQSPARSVTCPSTNSTATSAPPPAKGGCQPATPCPTAPRYDSVVMVSRRSHRSGPGTATWCRTRLSLSQLRHKGPSLPHPTAQALLRPGDRLTRLRVLRHRPPLARRSNPHEAARTGGLNACTAAAARRREVANHLPAHILSACGGASLQVPGIRPPFPGACPPCPGGRHGGPPPPPSRSPPAGSPTVARSPSGLPSSAAPSPSGGGTAPLGPVDSCH